MKQYILKRLLLIIPTILGAGILVFFLMRIIPGDICLVRWVDYGTDLDPKLLELCRNELGLNKPVLSQFLDFLIGVFSFDLGDSMWTEQPIIEEIKLRFALSLQVAIMTIILVIVISIPLGTISAIKQGSWIDYLIQIFSIAGVAIPSFWLGILVILGLLILSQSWLGDPWMPPIHYVSIFSPARTNSSQLIWPALVTGYRYSAVTTRMTRSALLEVLRTDYIIAARAKGLFKTLIIKRHALRNAILPIITIISMELSFFMGGLVITEQVFNLNGLGRLLVDSVLLSDYNMIQALTMLIATIYIVINFAVDLIYAYLDPRVRYS